MRLNMDSYDYGDYQPVNPTPGYIHLPPSDTGDIPQKYPLFRDEFNIVGPLVENLQLILLSCGAISVFTLAGTLFFNQQLPKWAKTGLLSFSVGSATLVPAMLSLSGNDTLIRMKGAIDKAREQQVRDHLSAEIAKDKIRNEMRNNDWHVQEITKIPVEQQLYYLQKYDLTGLVPWYTEAVKEVAPLPPVAIREGHQGTITEAGRMADDLISYKWIDKSFVESSKGVFGASGSGKTRVISILIYEFMRHNPDGEIRVIDSHFSDRPEGITYEDHSELTDEDSLWFLGVPDSIVKDYYVVSLQGDSKGKDAGMAGFAKRTIAMYERALRLLTYRKQHGIKISKDGVPNRQWQEKGGFRFHIVNDEFYSTLANVKSVYPKGADRIIQIISELRFEGRKYGIDMTLGLHSLKKGSIGVDSDVLLGNLSLLFLGAALNDPNTPLPTDLADQRIETYNAMSELGEHLEKGQGYACAVRKLGVGGSSKKIQVEVVPHIEFRDIWYTVIPAQNQPTIEVAAEQVEDELNRPVDHHQADSEESQPPTDYKGQINYKIVFQQMREWWQNSEETLTDADIIEKFKEVTGQPINPNAIAALLKVVKGDDPIV